MVTINKGHPLACQQNVMHLAQVRKGRGKHEQLAYNGIKRGKISYSTIWKSLIY
jgi:hypothetical protein